MKYSVFFAKSPIKIETIINQIGQTVDLYDLGDGDLCSVYAVIDQVVHRTEFFDTADFFDGSDYNPVLTPEGKILPNFCIDHEDWYKVKLAEYEQSKVKES